MENTTQQKRWEMTQEEKDAFERIDPKTFGNVKEQSTRLKSNFSWDMSTEEKEVLDRTLGKFRTGNETAGKQLAANARHLRGSILTGLQSDRYSGREERSQLQEDIYSYDNMLRQMSLYGYDVSNERNSITTIQDAANMRGAYFRQFLNEDEYIVSVPELRMKKYEENKQRIENGQGTTEELDELSSWNRRYERFYKVLDDYGEYTKNADFEIGSQNRSFANPSRQDYEDYHHRMDSRNYTIDDQGDMWYGEEKIDNSFFEKYQEPVTTDKLGLYLSASESDINDALNAFSEGNVSGYDKLICDGEGAHWELLTEPEVDIYYYLMNTQGKNAAYQYLDDMKVTLDRRYTIQEEQSHTDDSVPERILYSIASVPGSVFGGVASFLSDVAAYADGEEINPYDGAHFMHNVTSASRAATEEAMDRATENAAFLGISLGDVYQAAMSSADSFAGAYMLGGNGYGVVMGMGAASSEARRLYEAGASREQIAAGALLTGAAEMVFEKISIEHFVHLGNAKNIATAITNTLKQGGIEASEEIATELANTITNKIVMGSQSDFDQGVKEVMQEEGVTYAQAAAMYIGHNAWKAGAGGFMSGSMLGGTRSATSYARAQSDVVREGRRILDDDGYDKLRTIAEELAKKTAGKEAAKLGKYIAKADVKTTARNVGRVSNQVETIRQEQNRSYVRNVLIENGMNEQQAIKTGEYFLRAFETERLEKMISEGSADKILNNSAVLTVLDKIASLEESPANVRDQKRQLAMLGIKVNEDGAVDRESLAKTIFAAALFYPQTNKSTESQQTISDSSTVHRDNALIYTSLVSLGVQKAAAESLVKNYDPADGISPEIYARGAAEAFFYGKGSFPEAELLNGKGLAPVLTELQRSTAYRLGQIMNDTRRTNSPYGVERNEFTAQLDPQLVSAVDALAKLFRIRVRFGNLGENNGLYHADTGLIELDIAPQHRGASNAFLFSVSHELGHAVKERIGSEAWNAFAEYAVKAKGGEDAVKAKQESAAEYSEYSVAREEVVCDFIGELLSEQTALDDLCTSIKSGAFRLEAARGIVAAWHKLLNIFKGKTAQRTDAETAALVKRVQEQFGADIETAENAVKKLQQALSAALQTERSSNGKNRTVKASDKDTVDRETSMGYDKGSIVERSAENGSDRERRTADIPREVYSSGEISPRDSTEGRENGGANRRGNRAGGESTRGQKVPVFQYKTATPYQKTRIDELVSLAFDASEEWRDYLQTHPNIDMVSEVMRMYEEGDPRLRRIEETVPGLSEALYEVEAFIRQTTAQQPETAVPTAEQRGDTSLSEASDSEGNRLTKAQRDYFKDSVFRDREGRLLVLYHGSHFESFSVFELFRGIWMTTDKAYAETFAEFRDESEPLDGEVYTDEALKLYRLYAKAEHPANLGEIDGKLTEERLRRLAESLHIDYDTLENFFGYGIGKTSVFAVTRTERFLQLAREQGFDSFTATESGVPTYCVFANQNQVALTTNEAPTEHRDIRYSKKDTLDTDGTTATKAEDMPTARETVESTADTSQNKQAETEELSDHGTQNALSLEQRSAQEQPTVHSLLMETDASKVKNAIERKYLKEYQQTAARQLAEQQKLDQLQAELGALPKEKRQTARARFLRDEIIKTKNRLQICQSIQTRLETNSPLTYLIHREIKPRLAEVQKTAMPQTLMESATLPSGQNGESDFATEQNKHGQKRQYKRGQTAVAEPPKFDIITTRAAAASIYVNSSTDLFRNAKSISPIEGYEDIVIHGSKYGFEIRNADDKPIGIYSVNEFCDILKDDPNYHGGAIRLISCEAGADGSFVAQGLADRLGVVVLAPTDTIWVFPDGSMVIGEDEFTNSGEWREFLPKRKR